MVSVNVNKLLCLESGCIEHIREIIKAESEDKTGMLQSDLKIYAVYRDFKWDVVKQMVNGEVIIRDIWDILTIKKYVFDSMFLDESDMPKMRLDPTLDIATWNQKFKIYVHLLTSPKFNKKRKIPSDIVENTISIAKTVHNNWPLSILSTYLDGTELLFNHNYYPSLQGDIRQEIANMILAQKNRTSKKQEQNVEILLHI